MIKRNGLRDGVQLSGVSTSNGRGPQLVELQQINERHIDIYRDQLPFEELTTINPNRRIKLETNADKLSARVLDLMTPIGHGQRGLIDTEGVQNSPLNARKDQIAAKTPLGRVGVPNDIAPAVVFLASDESSWMTGETFYITGGRR